MPSTKKLSIAAAVGLLLLEVAGASCPFEFTFEKITVLLFPSKYLGVDVGADTILCKDLFEETTTGCMRNSLPHMIRAGLDADIDFECDPLTLPGMSRPSPSGITNVYTTRGLGQWVFLCCYSDDPHACSGDCRWVTVAGDGAAENYRIPEGHHLSGVRSKYNGGDRTWQLKVCRVSSTMPQLCQIP